MAPVKVLDRPFEPPMLVLIVAMSFVAAGYPSFVAHPVTLVAPVPLLLALLVLDAGRLTAPAWIALVGVMVTWTVLVYLAMAGTGSGLVHSLAMYAPFAALAFRVRRSEQIALAFAVITSALVSARVLASFLHAGARWEPWQVYEGNDLSARLNVLLPLVLVAWLGLPTCNRRGRILLMAVIGAGVTSIVLAQSRTALALLAAMLLLGLARTSWKALLIVVGATATAWLFMSSSITSLLERTRFVNFVPSSASRPEIWEVALDASRRSSWLGVGPGNSGDALRSVGDAHAHNSLVQTGLELGWPGALLVAGFGSYVVVLAARLFWKGGPDTLWALALFAYLGFSVFSSPIQRPDFSLALILVIMVGREHVERTGASWNR